MVSPQPDGGIAKSPINTQDGGPHCQSDKLFILRCALFLKDTFMVREWDVWE
jgi:hypothetical protein